MGYEPPIDPIARVLSGGVPRRLRPSRFEDVVDRDEHVRLALRPRLRAYLAHSLPMPAGLALASAALFLLARLSAPADRTFLALAAVCALFALLRLASIFALYRGTRFLLTDRRLLVRGPDPASVFGYGIEIVILARLVDLAVDRRGVLVVRHRDAESSVIETRLVGLRDPEDLGRRLRTQAGSPHERYRGP